MQLAQISKIAPPRSEVRPAGLPSVFTPGLYVHVPFCFHKCHYCDFYSITRQTPERMQRFVDLLLAEASRWAADQPGPTPRPRSVFFGGGTPTLLPIDAMHRLINGLRTLFDFSQTDEFTVEANPATVTSEYCSMLLQTGVNRLSFGAQSFHPDELATLERHHNPDDVPRSLTLAREAGFTRLNIDLIYAIPGQTLAAWQDNLERAIDLQTTHLSCYGLTYESNTPIAVKKRLGQIHPTDESIELQMLHHTRDRLAACGLSAYEISNYATPGQQCRHNLLYWMGEDYIGLGPSAASHVAGHRWKNRPHLGEWESAVASPDAPLPVESYEQLTPDQRAGELAMLQLRLARGLAFEDFQARTRRDARKVFADPIARLTALDLLESDGQSIRLTEKGLNVADAVAAEFILESA